MSQSKKRKEVIRTVAEAVGRIEDGMTVAIGGFVADNHPMIMVREIIRKGLKDLTIVGSATAGLDIDLLIGAGCARKVIAPYVGLEKYCPIGHNFRKAAEAKEIEIWECSEYTLYAALFAGSAGQDFMSWRGGIGSSIPELNPDFREFTDPIGGKKKYLAIPALRPDVAIIHVGWSDPYGNGQHFGAPFGDRWIARASDRIILVAEHVVPNDLIRKNPFMTSVSYADDVVEAPYGAHPYAAHGSYREDLDHLQEYIAASEANRKGDTKTWEKYLDTYIREPEDHVAYLERIGLRKLLGLYVAPIVTW
ncbi:MAG: CoA-transferase [Rhodospirillales bacterium]|jgi:glutaconate CoA-transferase subunit A|nr:CoA-transferase [Rhodospirillales bacterium]